MVWQEKAPYEAKASKKKDEYGKLMNAYNKKQVTYLVFAILYSIECGGCLLCIDWPVLYWQQSAAADGNAESDRSKSEVNDEDDEATGEVDLPISLFV